MFEKLKGTISGIQEGLTEAVETEKQGKSRMRKEKLTVAEAAKAAKAAEQAAAKKTSKEKLGQSKTVRKLAGLGAATAAALGAGQELHQKIKATDQDTALVALVGTPPGHPAQEGVSGHDNTNSFEALLGTPPGQSEDKDQPSLLQTGFGGGGLPPV